MQRRKYLGGKFKRHGTCVKGSTSCHQEVRLSDSFFAQLSFDVFYAYERAMLTCLRHLIPLVGPIYRHLHVLRWSGRGNSTGVPFYTTTCMDVVRFARATTPATVSR